jgi:hypothetical protein
MVYTIDKDNCILTEEWRIFKESKQINFKIRILICLIFKTQLHSNRLNIHNKIEYCYYQEPLQLNIQKIKLIAICL